MKNIHLVLAGESRLSLNRSYRDYAIGTEAGEPYWTYSQYKHHMSVTDASVRPHNMYITSDEEIKEGDWLFANQGANKIVEIKEGNYPYGSINNKGHKIFNSKHWKTKIILTTDQDLIKDGIQAINDEFLEWFVKNPSCESVEIKIWFDTSHISLGIGKVYHNNPNKPLYKIIIPKEEQDKKLYSEEDILDAWELGAKEGLPLTRKKKEKLFRQFKKK